MDTINDINDIKFLKAVKQYNKNAMYFNQYQANKRANYTEEQKQALSEYHKAYYAEKKLSAPEKPPRKVYTRKVPLEPKPVKIKRKYTKKIKEIENEITENEITENEIL